MWFVSRVFLEESNYSYRNFADTTRNLARVAPSAEAETASVHRVSASEILAETDLLGTGSSGAACADVGDFDVAPRQTRLPLQLAHGRVGCSAAGAHGPHYWLAFGTTLAVSDSLPIDRTLLVVAAFRRFAGILSCEIERPYDCHRDYSYLHRLFQKACIFKDVRTDKKKNKLINEGLLICSRHRNFCYFLIKILY